MKDKIGNIFVSLPQIWDFLDCQKNSAHEPISQIEGNIPEDVKELFTMTKDRCHMMDMSITMIDEALSCYRRRNALIAIMDDKKKMKDIMSENKDIIQENASKRLFGKKLMKKSQNT